MIRPGLVSVTFRQLPPEDVIAFTAQAGLEGIEWGGDVHVPPGDIARARLVGQMTRDAGLEVASYGSYYRLDGDGFEAVLETAQALGAPNIRVWAGRVGSAEATPEQWVRAVADARRLAGIDLSVEFHQGTLCDSVAATLRFLGEVESFKTYWQPRTSDESPEALLPHLSNLHVFHWTAEGRRPLAEGAGEWRRYLEVLEGERWALLEFVKDDSPEQGLRDAETLRQWLAMPVG